MRSFFSQLKKYFKVYKRRLGLPLFQINCLLCRGKTTNTSTLCTQCLDCFPLSRSFCARCGLPMDDQISAELCASCIQNEPAFDLCLSAFLYKYPVNRVIQKIKYNRRLELINPMTLPLAEILMDHYSEGRWPEVIIPVPLHRKRLRSRGFNQAHLLAKSLVKQLPSVATRVIKTDLIKRQVNTPSQQGLTAKERRKNIREAFSLNKKVEYQHVAVIDDVVTTAETISEISRLLKKNGVEKVDIWCLARTPETNKQG